MIFITVGTTPFIFDRLFQSLDEILITMEEKYLVVVQQGSSNYVWKYQKIITNNSFTPTEMEFYIRQASKIITHAGPGTLYMIFKNNGVDPLIIPRLCELKEHINNHQKKFLEFLIKKHPSLAKFTVLQNNIKNKLIDYITHKQEINSILPQVFIQTQNKILLQKINKFIISNG